MEVYRTDRHQIDKPSKFVERPDGYELTSNDGEVKVALQKTTVMDNSMESDFYHTVMWIREEGGWTRVDNTQSYRSKEEFINAISDSEDFTQALSEYKFNNQNNNEL